MLAWAGKRVKELEKEDLCGFIFKSDSPSSGMIRVKVYNDKGMPHKVGIGIFMKNRNCLKSSNNTAMNWSRCWCR
jgi:uncharacterized protein YbbK (DUF523 family)